MKVIQRGNPPAAETPIRTTCTKCRSIFEFHRAESEVVEHVFGTVYRVCCPVCVDMQNVPR